MQIFLKFPNPASRLIQITQIIECNGPTTTLSLPLWRPGRYEAQNYAKNIMYFEAFDELGHPVDFYKEDKKTWIIQNRLTTKIKVQYQYYAYQLDAGGSYIDDDFIYLNPVNFCMQCIGYQKPLEVYFQIPPTYKISCGLNFDNTKYEGADFIHTQCTSWYELYDSPIFASPNLACFEYVIENIPFKLWFYGIKQLPNHHDVIEKFSKFSQAQFDLFGSFPFHEYHFQFLILPFKYYHGVEHRNSTVIVLGDTTDFNSDKLNDDFLGISSHELFHAWNICKIRPSELSPYDYSKPVSFNTGFVAEGFTTYYGDYILYRTGVISKAQYEQELQAILTRHFTNPGNLQYSLSDASLDLWVDGYQPSHPERKVSIYDKGALISLVLDAHIEKLSHGQYSLDNVLKDLWTNFAQKNKSYTENDVYRLVEKYAGEGIRDLYKECIFGKTYMEDLLINALKIKDLQIDLGKVKNIPFYTKGYQYVDRGKKKIVEKINPQHVIYKTLSLNDEIIEDDGTTITVLRNGRTIKL